MARLTTGKRRSIDRSLKLALCRIATGTIDREAGNGEKREDAKADHHGNASTIIVDNVGDLGKSNSHQQSAW